MAVLVFTDAGRLSLGAGTGCSLVAVSGFSHLGMQASVVVAHSLQYEESSQTRDRTHIPCTGRGILNHCTTSEVPRPLFII